MPDWVEHTCPVRCRTVGALRRRRGRSSVQELPSWICLHRRRLPPDLRCRILLPRRRTSGALPCGDVRQRDRAAKGRGVHTVRRWSGLQRRWSHESRWVLRPGTLLHARCEHQHPECTRQKLHLHRRWLWVGLWFRGQKWREHCHGRRRRRRGLPGGDVLRGWKRAARPMPRWLLLVVGWIGFLREMQGGLLLRPGIVVVPGPAVPGRALLPGRDRDPTCAPVPGGDVQRADQTGKRYELYPVRAREVLRDLRSLGADRELHSRMVLQQQQHHPGACRWQQCRRGVCARGVLPGGLARADKVPRGRVLRRASACEPERVLLGWVLLRWVCRGPEPGRFG